VHAVQRLQADGRIPGNVLLLDGGTLGLTLLNHVAAAQRLLIIDAVDVGGSPGTLVRIEKNELRGISGSGSVHQLGFADLYMAMQMTAQEPQEMVVLGIQPGSTDVGTSLSPVVAGALDGIVEAAMDQIFRLLRQAETCETAENAPSSASLWEDACTN
jgi:hydrogenase maturation protease